jgi:transcriptional regulator GlxA family with amidase domain
MPLVMLVFDGVRLLDMTGPLEVFDVAASLGVPYRVTVCSVNGLDVITSSGLRVGVECRVAEIGSVDTLLVPGSQRLVTSSPTAPLVETVRSLASRARRVGSVCAGSFVLGAAGLLDGRTATTHWRYTAELARRFPTVTVDKEALYVRDGPVITSAGVAAGIDLALGLVEEDAGDEVAYEVARDLAVFMRRTGKQPQLSAAARTAWPRRELIRMLCDEIVADPAADHSGPSLAARACMSVRHLSRLFKHEMGCTPAAFVTRVRLEAATALIMSGEIASTAAKRSGLGSDETLRRTLRRQQVQGIP